MTSLWTRVFGHKAIFSRSARAIGRQVAVRKVACMTTVDIIAVNNSEATKLRDGQLFLGDSLNSRKYVHALRRHGSNNRHIRQ
ncbi:hypothetical protein D9M68_699430 [compost metagenome]